MTELEQRALTIAEQYLAEIGDRWTKHDAAVIARAREIAPFFGDDGELLIAAAILHDIGVSPLVERRGMTGLTAGYLLEELDFPERVVNLVANASCASVEARVRGLVAAYERFPDEGGPLRDALLYCCLTRGPDGLAKTFAEREGELLDRLRDDALMTEYMGMVRDAFIESVTRTEARIRLSPGVLGRVLEVPGMCNLRDLGGLPAGDRWVKKGVLFRSEAPLDLPANAVEQLAGLGLRSVIDLRQPDNAESVGTTLPEGLMRVSCPIPPPVDTEGRGFMEQILGGDLRDYTTDELAALYVGFLTDHASAFGKAVSFLADAGNHPTLIHCQAGKDRTGLLVALVLDVLDVPRPMIVEDYEATTLLRAHRAEQMGPVLEAVGTTWQRVAPLFSAPRQAIEQSFNHIGSAAHYLTELGGVTQESLDNLRRHLITDHDQAVR